MERRKSCLVENRGERSKENEQSLRDLKDNLPRIAVPERRGRGHKSVREVVAEPRPAWLAWLGVVPQAGRSQHRSPGRAQAWVVGAVGAPCGRQPGPVSLPLSCSFPLAEMKTKK